MRPPALLRRAALLAAAAAAILLPVPAQAWNRAGHMVHGALTYRDLRARAPKAANAMARLLEKHPHYRERWLPQLDSAKVTGARRDEMLFMLAARWPDDLRGDAAYDHPTWHYVNLPFVLPGDSTRPPAIPAGEIITEIGHNLSVVRDAQASDADRAIALCWVLHLGGDVHQPLHAVSLFGARWPTGDLGGNRFFVRREEGGRPTNLHSLWDGLITGTDSLATVTSRATAIGAAHPRARMATEVAVLAPMQWARDESLPLARAEAYQEGALPGSPVSDEAGTVPEGYVARARELAERRVALAAYRVSGLLATASR